MSRYGSPSTRWSAEHAGSAFRRFKAPMKQNHRTWWGAWWHACRINRLPARRERQAGVYAPYACYWTSDYREGEVGPMHWHVGQMPRDDMWGY